MKVRERKQTNRYLPGLLALTSALVLMLVLLAAIGSSKPAPDDPIPTTLPPVPENPYGPADFTYGENGYLTCTAGESILGIDVSSYQEDIDWQQVKEAGVEFVMIRVGYRGYDAGGIHTDRMAQAHYDGAKAAGLKIGAYFFSQAITVQEAIAEAEYAMNVMRSWELDMPLVYDWEYISEEARTADVDARLLTDCARGFCLTAQRAGYTPMVYFNYYQARDLMYLEELTNFDWWLAMYSDEMDYPYQVQMWQYTSQGSVPGIEGEVDLNLWFPEE